MSSTMVQCPNCQAEMPESARFCPGCKTPRTTVRQELEARAQETGRPYDELVREMLAAEETMPSIVPHDRKDQFQRIQNELLPSETLYAVYDLKGRGTGFVGFTDKRVIYQDDGRVLRNGSVISLPYAKVNMVASGYAAFSASVSIVAVGDARLELEFRSTTKADHARRIVLEHILD